MGFNAAHQPRFRVFCCLMASFWAGMILLGAVRLACAVPAAPHAPRMTVAPPAVSRCPMCTATAQAGMQMAGMQMAGMQMAGMQMAGMQMAGMKCCCHAGGASSLPCQCACRPLPQPRTVTVLVWSPVAVLPVKQSVTPPASRTDIHTAVFSLLLTLSRTPLPRPPRLL